MGKIIVIGSQKGGVGKTTTTLNLAYSLKELGKKVLTVDFDSQANLTTCYGVEDTGALEYTIGHLMMAQMEEEVPESFEDYIQSREGVDYIPSSIYLSVVDAKLRTEMGAERMLAEVLEALKSRYDYILIDTCPSLGMLDVAKSSTRRKFDEEYPTSTEEFDSVYLCRNIHFYSSLYGIIHIPPESCNIWIGSTPGVNQWLQFIFH